MMKDPGKRTVLILSILAVSVLVVGCAESGSTPDGTTSDGTTAAGSEPIEAAAEPEARFVTVSVPAGTEFEVELLDTLSSGTNQVGDPVGARLVSELYADGKLVASAGSELRGTVSEVVPLKKFGGQPSISVAFDSLGVEGGETVAIMAWLGEAGKKQAGRDAAKIGGGAAAGAVVGHQLDGDKGSEIGALVGGAIGTVIAAKTGKEIELVAGTTMVVVLESDAQVSVPE
jgi:hypothetical protein